MKKLTIIFLLLLGSFCVGQENESSIGLHIGYPLDNEVSQYNFGIFINPMWELSEDSYLGGYLGLNYIVLQSEDAGGAELPLADFGASYKYYFLEFVYAQVNGGISYNGPEGFFTVAGFANPTIGYSFNSTNVFVGYRKLFFNDANLDSIEAGISFKFF
ncbi:hypothetical protein BST92_05340 [Nonlabens arenilitoris]|uniref:Outer membrane protein beta-barrel domain-containing protein n=1 Tax=Nonlabens arenilitoris TaxID=1217969 RepID=A0A2S7U9T3_9FLAO|nr:hypothetical protein [Nonlabens arenilitoris]PQJ31380.1 hypothetical protein BST92_05340 [Nonlabens arenilitoris]